MTKKPRPRRAISNQEFEKALLNSDNANIIKAVTQRFLGVLSSEDLKACGLQALWRCLQYHQDRFGQKFTTSLHRLTDWECKRELRKQRGGKINGKIKRAAVIVPLYDQAVFVFPEDEDFLGNNLYNPLNEDLEHIRERMKHLPFEWQRKVVEQYYFRHMTMEQIGKANGYSKEAARQKLKKTMVLLRRLCDTGA
jgi:DNA-directed RNA polymerase specialized sigma24 family protein